MSEDYLTLLDWRRRVADLYSGVRASLRGQQREDFVAQLLVIGGRVAHEAIAVGGRPLERVVEDAFRGFPAFGIHAPACIAR